MLAGNCKNKNYGMSKFWFLAIFKFIPRGEGLVQARSYVILNETTRMSLFLWCIKTTF